MFTFVLIFFIVIRPCIKKRRGRLGFIISRFIQRWKETHKSRHEIHQEVRGSIPYVEGELEALWALSQGRKRKKTKTAWKEGKGSKGYYKLYKEDEDDVSNHGGITLKNLLPPHLRGRGEETAAYYLEYLPPEMIERIGRFVAGGHPPQFYYEG